MNEIIKAIEERRSMQKDGKKVSRMPDGVRRTEKEESGKTNRQNERRTARGWRRKPGWRE